MRVYLKTTLFLCILITYGFFALPLMLIQNLLKVNIGLSDRLASWGSALGLKVLGVTVTIDDKSGGTRTPGSLVVSNHVSYLDILVLLSHSPSRFITSIELGRSGLFGMITQLACCILVERRNKERRPQELREIAQALKDKMNVVLFAEATTGDGTHILRFRRPLFQPAIDLKIPVECLCFNYLKFNGEPVTAANKDKVFWYGDMPLFAHLKEFLKLESIEVKMTILPSFPAEKFEKNQDLANYCHGLVSNEFTPILGEKPASEPEYIVREKFN
jgi:1-acyl-sn-glycerol-3-phosphate acyltransferase